MEKILFSVAQISDGKRMEKVLNFELTQPMNLPDFFRSVAKEVKKSGADEFLILDINRESIPGLQSPMFDTFKLEELLILSNEYLMGKKDIFWFQLKFPHLKGKTLVREYELRDLGKFSSVQDLFSHLRSKGNIIFLKKYGPFDWSRFDQDEKPLKSPDGRFFLS